MVEFWAKCGDVKIQLVFEAECREDFFSVGFYGFADFSAVGGVGIIVEQIGSVYVHSIAFLLIGIRFSAEGFFAFPHKLTAVES